MAGSLRAKLHWALQQQVRRTNSGRNFFLRRVNPDRTIRMKPGATIIIENNSQHSENLMTIPPGEARQQLRPAQRPWCAKDG
jgi:hypothetical protein